MWDGGFVNFLILIYMERSFDLKATACFLPDIKIRKYRSISASMENEEENEESVEVTPYFGHSRHQSSMIENYEGVSDLFHHIIQEHSKIRNKISQQAKFIEKMCKRPPAHFFKRSPLLGKLKEQKENIENFSNGDSKDFTFRSFGVQNSAKEVKRFRFPREVFRNKTRSRQSNVDY